MFQAAAKRVIDVVVSLVALIAFAPIIAIVALLIRVRLGRPILFRQHRPGRKGVLFELWKFRTMSEGNGTDDERLTPLGLRLRSLSLDELPQLWNILRGDMSLVGPRPLLPEYLGLFSARQGRRHEVRPGLTGLSQISGRNQLGWEERLELDVRYVENRTIRGDFSILIDTFLAVLRREGIAGDGHVTMERFKGSDACPPSAETPSA